MPKLLIAEITRCGSCPFCMSNMTCQLKDNKQIPESEDINIPDWCPLPYANEDIVAVLFEMDIEPMEDSVFDFLAY